MHYGNTGRHSMMAAARGLYYSPSLPSAFSTVKKLAAATKTKSRRSIKSWLLKQDSYALHRPVLQRFPRNSYTVTNVMYVWECDVMDMQSVSKSNDKYKYLLRVIDTFSKYLHIVSLRSKTGTAVSSTFRPLSQSIRNRYADVPSGCEQIGANNF